MWVISKLWIDQLENHPSKAYGYARIGFVSTPEARDKIINSSFIHESEYPWPLNGLGDPTTKLIPVFIAEKLNDITDEVMLESSHVQ